MITKQQIVRLGVFVSLFNLLAATSIGLLLRFHKVFPLSWLVDRNLIHAHSHSAFLGWAFIAFIITAYSIQMPDIPKLNRNMVGWLVVIQTSVLGMLVTFPFTGYGFWSIIFASIHMGASVAVIILYFKNTDGRKTGVLYIRVAMLFYLLSGIGPLALGPIMALGLKGTPVYDMAVYFYLHFQYNGWFTLAIVGLLYQQLDSRRIIYNLQVAKRILLPFMVSVILTLILSAAAFDIPPWLVWIGFSGSLISLSVFFILIKQVFPSGKNSSAFPDHWAKLLVAAAMLSWFIKLSLQVMNGIPDLAGIVFLRDSIMFYLHLTFLGMMTCFIFGLWVQEKFISVVSRWIKVGFILFLFGLLFSETSIGLKVFAKYLTYEFYSALNAITLAASLLLFLSLTIIVCFSFIIPQWRSKQTH